MSLSLAIGVRDHAAITYIDTHNGCTNNDTIVFPPQRPEIPFCRIASNLHPVPSPFSPPPLPLSTRALPQPRAAGRRSDKAPITSQRNSSHVTSLSIAAFAPQSMQ